MTQIQKRVADGLSVTTLGRDNVQEHFVTATPKGDETPESLFQRVGDAVRGLAANVVSVESLGMSASDRMGMAVLSAAVDGGNVPLGWVENSRTDNLCGVHVWAISGTPVKNLAFQGRRVGTVFEDDYARYCRLVGLLPENPKATRSEQTQTVLDQMETLLNDAGMAFSDVLRTWFYNDDILAWYRDFNVVRTRFFHERKVFDGLLPASTGIGGRNAVSGALSSGLIAVRAGDQDVRMSEVPSPLQSPAPTYGSSFSRAVELEVPNLRRIYVSGTASIDGNGKSIFLGDPVAQVRQTMDVVQAILKSREMDWGDVTRALAYFKRAQDAPLFAKYREENGVPPFPVIVVENDVCRDELLFEIEVDAIATT